MTLEGRVALVTGAAKGIGEATAALLAERGARLVLVDLDAGGLDAVAERLAGIATVVGDVADADTCERLVETARERFGGLDLLVNNAAVGVFGKPVDAWALAEWNRVLAVNLTGVFLLSRAAIPAMRERGGGVIVNVSSVHAFASSTGAAAYAAAKGGVLALTRAMALDCTPDGIRVNAVVPGATDTPMLHGYAEQSGTSLEDLGFTWDPRAIARVATPREVAAAIAFLLSPDASFVNGAPLIVDGGLLAGF